MSDDEDEDIAMGNGAGNDSVLSHTPPSAKKQKKAPAPKKTTGQPLATVENEVSIVDGPSEGKSKTASDRYQKVLRSHSLLGVADSR